MRRKNGSFHIKTSGLNSLTPYFQPKSVFGFLVRRRSETKFAPTRREKRGTVPMTSERVYPDFIEDRSALHEYFCNEVGVNFGHLQRE